MRKIDIAEAKQQLKTINSILTTPHLLIGGLAVQQYLAARNSMDIDLICDFEIARQIIEKYPGPDWEVTNLHEDEYRPSYKIESQIFEDFKIIFGPKILQREPYDYIDWQTLKLDAKPFNFRQESLHNILVPTPSALAFTKLISFIGRSEDSFNKIEQDLEDFIDLSNHRQFSIVDFYNFIRKNKAETYLVNDLVTRAQTKLSNLKKSTIFILSEMLVLPLVKTLDTKPSYIESILNEQALDVTRSDNRQDSILEQAQKEYEAGNFSQALNILKQEKRPKETKNSQEYNRLYIAILTADLNQPKALEEAEEMLPEIGTPVNYSQVAFHYWKINDLDKAIDICKKGIKKAKSEKLDESLWALLENSLAYYYADANKWEHANEAMIMAKKATELAKITKKDSTDKMQIYADRLDTLGYVKISFSVTVNGIKEGIADCSTAKELGGTPDLFSKHLLKAQNRINHLE